MFFGIWDLRFHQSSSYYCYNCKFKIKILFKLLSKNNILFPSVGLPFWRHEVEDLWVTNLWLGVVSKYKFGTDLIHVCWRLNGYCLLVKCQEYKKSFDNLQGALVCYSLNASQKVQFKFLKLLLCLLLLTFKSINCGNYSSESFSGVVDWEN